MDNPPDRLSVQEDKPFFDPDIAKRISVFIDGVEHKDDVVEYCISGGWARIIAKGPNGQFLKNLYGTGPRIKKVQNLKIEVKWK